MEIVRIGFFVGALALYAAGAPQEAEAEPSAEAAQAFSVAPDEDGLVQMSAVLRAFEGATDWTLTMNQETARLVDATRFWASAPIECGADEAARVVGALLSSQNYCWHVVRPEAPGVLAISSLDTTARGTGWQDAPFVPVEQLGEFADSAGLLIRTLVTLPHTDVRTLANSMRSMVVDPNVLQVIPVGNTNSLVVQGFATNVFDLVAILRAVDRASGGDAGPDPAQRPVRIHGASGEHIVAAIGDDQPTMLDLVGMHAEATGQVAIIGQEAMRLLQAVSPSLSAPVRLSGDAFATFCEEILRERGFVVGDLSHGEPCLYTVQSLDTTARATARMRAGYVDVASIASCARRPATIFTTLIELPKVDVRTLSNSMRSLVVDPNLLQIIPVGNTTSMIVQGRGRELVAIVEMLRSVEAAQPHVQERAEAPGGEGEDEDEGDR